MAKNRKIILVGPMGAGKTSLGRRLANQLNYQFFDTDHEITKKVGVSIPEIFEYEGEEGFREREYQVLEALTALDKNLVIACGGGIILLQKNREIIMKQDLIVFLDVPVERQLKRIGNDPNRPLTQAKDKRKRLQALRDERLGLYEGISDFRINTDNNIFSDSLRRLFSKVKKHLAKLP